MQRFERLRNRILPLVSITLLVLLLALVLLAPAEARLGNVVKLVYVHGALIWVGLALYAVAGLLGLAALVIRRPMWYRATTAAGVAALPVWVVYVISAMAVTGLAWGQLFAWNEPRVRATILILLADVVLLVAARLVGSRDFTAIVNIVMAVLTWFVIRQAEVIRHPVNPIGSSDSDTIQVFYLLIVMTVAGLAAILVTWLWVGLELKARAPARADG